MTTHRLPFTPDWLGFVYPWALLGLLLLPVLWRLWRSSRRRTVLRISSIDIAAAAAGKSSGRARAALPILRTMALAALIVAAARPQRADESSKIFAEGIAIMMCVDTSTSMTGIDLSPPGSQFTRLDIVKEVFRRFVVGDGADLKGRKNDLIGMIRFARYADSVCPLTLDRANLLEVLKQTRPVQIQDDDGTAIGDGLALAVERMKDLKRVSGSGEQLKITSRVVILLTDGENNFGLLTPQQAGDLAARHGIKVYTILAGTGRDVGFGRRLPVDDKDMLAIAEATGGKFFRADDAGGLLRVYEEIDKLERTRTEERRFVRWGELARPFLLFAFAALLLQTLLDATWLRKAP
jgi:Ca-activated chloride channel homolog